jgi:hypothetical protein
VRDFHARHRGGAPLRRGDPRPVPRQDADLQLLAQLQLEEAPLRRRDRPLPARARRPGVQVPVRDPGRLPRAQLLDVPAGERVPAARHAGLHRAAAGRVRGRVAGLHRHPPTRRRWAPATSTG